MTGNFFFYSLFSYRNNRYYRANTVRYQNDNCEGVCMLNHYCAITRVDYKEFRQCLEKEQSALRSSAIAQCVNGKNLLILAMVMVLGINYIQNLCEFGRNLLRQVSMCHRFKEMQNYQLYKIIAEMRIKLKNAFVYPYEKKEYHGQVKTKDFNETPVYNIETVESKIYPLAIRQQEHNCGHCLQQRAMNAPVNKSNIHDKEYKGIIRPMMAKVNKRKYEISSKYKKKINTLNTQYRNVSNDLHLEYFKLRSLLLLYSIRLNYKKFHLRLHQQHTTIILSKPNAKCSSPLFTLSSWIYLKSKCCWGIPSSIVCFFPKWLLISGGVLI